MSSVIIKTLPALAGRSFAEPFEKKLSLIGESVVFAGNIEDLIGLYTFEDLGKRIEFLRFRKVRQIAGMDHKRRPSRKRVNFIDRRLQRVGNVRVRIFTKTDVRVADLDKR